MDPQQVPIPRKVLSGNEVMGIFEGDRTYFHRVTYIKVMIDPTPVGGWDRLDRLFPLLQAELDRQGSYVFQTHYGRVIEGESFIPTCPSCETMILCFDQPSTVILNFPNDRRLNHVFSVSFTPKTKRAKGAIGAAVV
jgi:hypothetical protein